MRSLDYPEWPLPFKSIKSGKGREVLQQKPPYYQEMKLWKTPQKIPFHIDCGPT